MKVPFALMITLASASALAAQDAATPDASSGQKRCLDLVRIEQTEVIDNKHIIFHVSGQGDPMYLNTLPHECVGLTKTDPLLYKTSLSELCDLDMITVLHQQGAGFMRGASCGLGKFEPVTKEQVQMLKQAEHPKP
jgi:hypothetical protein